jgi:predicted HD superfamily hydrolase involved in NAD metabolism
MDLESTKKRLQYSLTPKRFAHSLNVMETSVKLADKLGEDREKAKVSGLLHDCARDIRGNELLKLCERFDIALDGVTRFQPDLLHGVVGSQIARLDYKINDESILNAIKYHTTGREDMSLLEKIVFIADYIEPGRSFPGVDDIRKIAYEDIDTALIMGLGRTIQYIAAKNVLMHLDTIKARNYLIFKTFHNAEE